MSELKNIKRISSLLGLLLCVALFSLGCNATSNTNTSVKNEKPAAETKGAALKDLKDVKVSKPNDGGLKQELSTKAAVSTSDNKQITFEVPASQLQGLKVGDALAINSGKDAYPATIVTMPSAQPANPNPGTKVIITAQVGPGINLPGNKRDYTVTYLYNNRDPRVHDINRNYVYYDDSRPYIYITGPDRVIRRKYIRIGLINRYYTEILDELDDTYRIVEDYINDYVENVIVPSIVEDYTNQVINEYQEYIDSLNKRWDYDDQVNTFTINVDDVDWEKLEEQDTILTEQDIKEIYEQVQTEKNIEEASANRDENDNQDSGIAEVESASHENTNDDKSDDEKEIEAASADRDEASETSSYKSEANEEVTNSEDEDVNTTTTFDNAGNDDTNDEAANENYSQNDEQQDYGSQNDVQDYNSNDDNSSYDDVSSNDDYSSNDDNDSYFGGDDSSDEAYENTAEAFGDDED